MSDFATMRDALVQQISSAQELVLQGGNIFGPYIDQQMPRGDAHGDALREVARSQREAVAVTVSNSVPVMLAASDNVVDAAAAVRRAYTPAAFATLETAADRLVMLGGEFKRRVDAVAGGARDAISALRDVPLQDDARRLVGELIFHDVREAARFATGGLRETASDAYAAALKTEGAAGRLAILFAGDAAKVEAHAQRIAYS